MGFRINLFKNKKRLRVIVAAFSFFFASTLALSSCGSSSTSTPTSSIPEATTVSHQHTFSDAWSYDGHQHWHESTCEHSGLKEDVADHTFSVSETPATFQDDGVRTYTCTVCHYSYSETMPHLSHSYSEEWSHDEVGHWHACTDEGFESLKIDYSLHDYEVSTVEATFEEDGYVKYTCKDCGHSYTETLTKKEHRYSTDYKSDEHGHWHPCIDEGYEDVVLGYEAHDFEDTKVDSTFDSEGEIKHVCKVCGYTYTETIGKKEHHYASEYSHDEQFHWHACTDEGYGELYVDKKEHDFETRVVEPTYEEEGYTLHTCKDCGYSYKDTPIQKKEHHYSQEWSHDGFMHWHQCIDEGYEDLKCDYETHNYSIEETPATFEEYGYKVYTCDDCGASFISYGKEYKEHSYSDEFDHDENHHWHPCIDEGYENLSAGEDDHSFGNWIVDSMPSSSSEGSMHRECVDCHYEGEHIALPTSCANPEYVLSFRRNGEGYEVTNYSDDGRPILIIPETHDNLPVTGIASNALDYSYYSLCVLPNTIERIGYGAFQGCQNLKSIYLPDSVTSISGYCFSYSPSLTDVRLSSGLASIPYCSFFQCTSLLTIDIPEGVTGIDYDAFNSCFSLTSVTLPSTLAFMDGNIFRDCANLGAIQIPANVQNVQTSAFFGCSKLEKIDIDENNEYYRSIDGALYSKDGTSLLVIPGGISGTFKIAEGALYVQNSDIFLSSKLITTIEISSTVVGFSTISLGSESSVKEIKVNENNQNYEVVDNILYSKTHDTLVWASKDQPAKLTIDDRVGTIGVYAFEGNALIEEVGMSDNVTSINEFAFRNCSSLKKINLSSSLTYLGYAAFYLCSSLSSIVLPDSLSYLHGSTFSSCASLTSIKLPSSLSSLPNSFFEGCSSLETVDIPETVSSIESYCFMGCSLLKEIEFPEKLSYLGYSSFSNCLSLEMVKIPDSVTYIESYCFEYCESLKKATWPASFSYISCGCFRYCYSLCDIEIPDTVTYIQGDAFRGCESLYTITIPSNVTDIYSGAFYECNALVEIVNLSPLSLTLGSTDFGRIAYYAKSIITDPSDSLISTINEKYITFKDGDQTRLVTYIGDEIVAEVPNGITTIGVGAFAKRKRLVSVKIPSSVTSADSIFHECYRLSEIINLSNCDPYNMGVWSLFNITNDENGSLVSIEGDYVYFGDTNDSSAKTFVEYIGSSTDLYLPLNVSGIGPYAFYGLSYKSVHLTNEIKKIGNDAFYNCKITEGVFYEGTASQWASIEFSSHGSSTRSNKLYFNGTLCEDITLNGDVMPYAFAECKTLKSVTITDNAGDIGDYAFYGCTDLINVKLGNNVSRIGHYAFYNDEAITELALPHLLTEIWSSAFENTGLTDVDIPNSVTSLNYRAFANCKHLEHIVLPSGDDHIFVDSSILEGSPVRKIYYHGDESEWDLVHKNMFYFYPNDRHTLYFYSENKPNGEGNYWRYENGIPKEW
ncbi:MAG: leucine-rich repeat domain-containing protein [Bacilli bacterium]|nr:leucine-rich repeat domain-containing protein [Bacilli bacterium]